MHIELWRECLKEKACFEDKGVDGRKVSPLILKQQNDCVCVCVCVCVFDSVTKENHHRRAIVNKVINLPTA